MIDALVIAACVAGSLLILVASLCRIAADAERRAREDEA